MKTLLLVVFALAGAAVGRAVETAHLFDPDEMIPGSHARALEYRLETFQKETGINAVMRLHELMPAPEEDDPPGVYMRTLSTKLGLIEDGVLMVYFAEEKEWRVWIGDHLTARFAGKPGTAAELTESGAMHDAKEAWLEAVFADAEKRWQDWTEKAHAEPRPEDKVRFEASALVSGLRARFAAVAN